MESFLRIAFGLSAGVAMAFLITVIGAFAVLSMKLPDGLGTAWVIFTIAGAIGGQTARIVTVDDGF